MNKTVYVLGAGFSMDAGAPSQENLVKKIFSIDAAKKDLFLPDSVEKFRKFLIDTLSIPKEYHDSIPLEDIFTPLDKCLQDNLAFRDLNVDDIKEKRHLIYYLIGKTLQTLLYDNAKMYIDKFAGHLVEECSRRMNNNYGKVDNVSVITTNWDILLDTSIQDSIDHKFPRKAVVDYCCYISSYKKKDERVKPGLEILGQGGFNVKLIKLHGSLNWLQCPRCQRVYVDMDDKIAVNQFIRPIKCRHCNDNFGIEESHTLVSNIIMPTFLKNLTNPQYKLLWQNAGVELSEAKKIVFIGYSLPQADYEMRQLLSRMVRKDAEISVVACSHDPEKDIQFQELGKRYKIFFGNRLKMPIYVQGAKEYINQKISFLH